MLGLVVALVYPKIELDRHRKQIEERLHLFITRMTILSTTNIDRVEIIRTPAAEKEYRALAEELARIVALVDTWNQSLEEAARLRAKRVPSPLMPDFLERMAYALGAGQELQEFLLTEQDEIIGKFVISYENDLDKLTVLKELHLSMTLSTTFALVFGIITPLLTGMESGIVIGGIVALFVIVQVGFVLIIHMVSPMDPIWYHTDLVETDRDQKILLSHLVGIVLTLGLTGLCATLLFGYLPYDGRLVPLPLYLAIPLTPMLYPAWVMRNEENAIKERDESFGSFIRVLGAVESVKQSSTGRVLKTLRKKDFGALTENINGLHARLSM
ncbi:type II secretion system F family protein [Halogranum rubrum]|uniref:type II secretion system F family protein n=1 Tax=Halogranum rubrum TaxID=553466 RepID=UPI000A571911|nr:type II secretion system F family protein [Halogranum rubrum]